jgi:CheY-like chemotaxis protein
MPLAGRKILLVEDEPVIAIDVAHVLQKAGAHVVTSRSPQAALALIEADGWSAVVLAPELIDGDSAPLREQLRKRGIPFVLYGVGRPDGARHEGVWVSMSAGPAMLVRKVEELMQGRSMSR